MNDKVWFPASTSSILFFFSCCNSPHIHPVKSFQLLSLHRAQPRLRCCQSWMANPAVQGCPFLSAPLEAAQWVMQPRSMRHESGSAWWRWGFSWALPLPTIPGWPRPDQLALHPAWAEPDSPWPAEGSWRLLPTPAGLLLSRLPVISKANPPVSWAWGLLEQSRESAWWKLSLLSPRQGHVF